MTPRIYVGCLSAYNEGTLFGRWIEFTDEEFVREEIAEMLAESPAEGACEEWGIFDAEFGGLSIDQHEDLSNLEKVAELFKEYPSRLVSAVVSYYGGPHYWEFAVEAFEERYIGEFENMRHFGEEMIDQFVEVPENLENYINYEAYARDMRLGGDIVEFEIRHNEVHVFWTH
jgi:antirestriction protein